MSTEISKEKGVVTVEQQGESDLLTRILEKGKMARNEVQAQQAKDMIGEFVHEVMQGQLVVTKDMESAINARIAEIDRLLSAQLNEIMHAPEFQKLEGSWRGLHHLVMNSETSAKLKIKVFNVTKRELFKDLDKAVEFDQSQTFKKLYENEFGTPGGEPYGALVGDYEFGNHPEDVELLSKMSNVAAAAFCPFISAAAPKLFAFDSWND